MSFIELKLTPVRMMFPKKEADNKNDFRIYACITNSSEVEKNEYGNVSIKGVMQRLELDTEYTAQIVLDKIDPKFGASYNIISIYQDVPETLDGQKEFLATMMTEIQLAEVYRTYPDEDIIELIMKDKFDYKKVKHFGEKTLIKIKNRIEENIEFKDILSKYARFGITYEIITKLKTLLGSIQLATQKLDECPYILTKLNGFGFKRADKIARAMGVQFNDENRIEYGIRYTLEDNEQQGHTFMYRDELLRSSSEKLEVEECLVEQILEKTGELKFIDDKVSLIKAYNAEKYIAKRLKMMLSESNGEELNFNPDEFIKQIENKYKDILVNGLTHQQKDFFRMIRHSKAGLLAGYAGTGKSQLQKFLIELLSQLKLTYTLLSPSAQAAKVTKQYTGFDAQTIHRKIGYGAGKDEEMMYEINEDFVIIDESGMTDIYILSSLLAKIKNPKARILFVGDDFQFLSIQAGNVLHDSIESGVIPMTKLDIVFRQEEGGLLDVATKIRKGEYFLKDDFEGKKLFGKDLLIHCLYQADMENGYKHYYNYLLNEYEPEEIMVLTPTKKNKLGTVQINKYIQSIVNAKSEDKLEYEYGKDNENVIRVGDYILNTTNMYRVKNLEETIVDIVNGDSGKVIDLKFEDAKTDSDELLERDKKGIIIEFDTGAFRIDYKDVFQLLAAWCRTGHKAQGDSAPAVLSIVDRSHKFQVSANMLYTMLTRAKKKGILITQAETINFAIRKVESKRRNTHLCELLRLDSFNE
ncbi:AAA family ATPase [Paenibacillus sp. HJL G12]|uniref:AAA family ATPase n=1 Tax=Paenibacillus dendrobii TaxID=2691084 RepID=A0A7X3IJ67_9BACL|nr:ATP-dependent RecD-like DNA helicase [Paenibacillus dendrobii]MWV44952.1 AAA family ATPase [Paenibacillus dendrobii]